MRWWIVALVGLGGCRLAPALGPIETHSRPEPRPAENRSKLVVTSTQVEILDPIRFLSGSAAIDPRSMRILDAIASTLTGNPSIRLVAVRAYGADAIAQFQGRVGADRAQAIVNELVARGVSPGRLLPRGAASPPAGSHVGPVFEILDRGP